MTPNQIALGAALVVLVLMALAERWHARRCRAVGRLAFGPTAQPRLWTNAVPPLRVAACTALAWGLTVLSLVEPRLLAEPGATGTDSAEAEELQRVMLVLDVSPSMNIVDAGVDKTLRRRDRMLQVVEGIFSRIALGRTRFSVVVFFTSARPVVVDAADVNVIRNILDNLPLVWSFAPGETNLFEGLRVAGDLTKDWAPKSTTLLLCTDGDTIDFSQVPQLPRAIRNVEILAVGDPLVGTFISNHDSRQQAGVLRRLAAELHGSYHNVNTHHVPTAALADLARVPPQPAGVGWRIEDLARIAVMLGAVLLTLIPLALQLFGNAWNAQRELPAAIPDERPESEEILETAAGGAR